VYANFSACAYLDASVWIDYFNGVQGKEVELLDRLLGKEPLASGDLILTEVLQSFGSDQHFDLAKRLLETLVLVEIGGQETALQAAMNSRALRKRRITVRKTIDTMIATRCIESGLTLLHRDRDFEPFERYLGLRAAR
jgi:predicted nucleic acid-binding protein